MANRRILIVEDEAVLRRILRDALQSAGYDVATAENGIEGLDSFKNYNPELVIADIMMPEMDGLDMVEQMRKLDKSVEILFLSARSGTEDIVDGFHRGGNDYIRKPFALDELLARVEALLARHTSQSSGGDEIRIGNYHFNSRLWTLTHNGTTRRLTARESAILSTLAESRGEIVSSHTLLTEIWGDDSYYNLRSLNVFVSKLRGYLAQDPNIEIQSIRNSGYRLLVNKEK